MTSAARELLTRSDPIIFDFDGPLCDVFAGLPAPKVARMLEALIDEHFDTDDPLEVLRLAYKRDAGAGAIVEDQLIRAEVDAVRVSVAEAAGVEALCYFQEAGKTIGVVSNNSGDAVRTFLDQLDLSDRVSVVVGRAFRRPDLMKPDPWPLREALTLLRANSEHSVLIGDTLTDIEASERAGIACVGYANKPSKVEPFTAAGVPTVTTMAQLLPSPGER